MNFASYYCSYIDFYTLTYLYHLHLYLSSMHWLLHHISIFITHYSTHIAFLQTASSLLRNWNRTNDVWGGFFWKSISLNNMFSFSKPKISFTEMFHESIEKQFNWNLMLRYSVKSTLNQYFMKCSQRKISVYPSLKVSLSF